MLFGGNLLRQPAFVQLKSERPNSFKVISKLYGSDQLMENAVFLGTYPGLTEDMLKEIVDTISNFIDKKKHYDQN